MRDLAAVKSAAADFIARHGVPDLVIGNAGVSYGTLTEYEEDAAAFREILEVNVMGLVNTFHPFVAPMRVRGSGTLAGIASVAGFRGLPGASAYSASKAAAIRYLEALRLEMRGSGVKVCDDLPRLHRHADDGEESLSDAVHPRGGRRGAAHRARDRRGQELRDHSVADGDRRTHPRRAAQSRLRPADGERAGASRESKVTEGSPSPGCGWMLSTQKTSSGFSTTGMSRFTTTGSWPLRSSTHSSGSFSLALISWCGTKGGTQMKSPGPLRR